MTVGKRKGRYDTINEGGLMTLVCHAGSGAA